MSAYQDRRKPAPPAWEPVPYSPTDRAALDTLKKWRPNERIARGSPRTKTRKAHQMCAGDGQCGTKSVHHCGGRYWAARSSIAFCKGDASLRIALGAKRQARIRERGW